MNEFNQNSRTLIVSFVVAIMVLIPLRFVEAGQLGLVDLSVAPTVLGETSTNLPVLEAPYEEVEAGQYNVCLTVEEANAKVYQLEEKMASGELTDYQVADALNQIESVKLEICK